MTNDMDTEKFGKYIEFLNRGLPKDLVRRKMKYDGFPYSQIDEFLRQVDQLLEAQKEALLQNKSHKHHSIDDSDQSEDSFDDTTRESSHGSTIHNSTSTRRDGHHNQKQYEEHRERPNLIRTEPSPDEYGTINHTKTSRINTQKDYSYNRSYRAQTVMLPRSYSTGSTVLLKNRITSPIYENKMDTTYEDEQYRPKSLTQESYMTQHTSATTQYDSNIGNTPSTMIGSDKSYYQRSNSIFNSNGINRNRRMSFQLPSFLFKRSMSAPSNKLNISSNNNNNNNNNNSRSHTIIKSKNIISLDK